LPPKDVVEDSHCRLPGGPDDAVKNYNNALCSFLKVIAIQVCEIHIHGKPALDSDSSCVVSPIISMTIIYS